MKNLWSSTVKCLWLVAMLLVVPAALAMDVDAAEAAAAVVQVAASAGWLGSMGTWLGYGVTAVGAASLVVQGLSMVTGMTPSKADDEFINGAYRWLARAQRWLDRLALNPPASKARRR